MGLKWCLDDESRSFLTVKSTHPSNILNLVISYTLMPIDVNAIYF